MDAPEAASIYININTTKAPMDDVRVRKAFDLAIDKIPGSSGEKLPKPLPGITPTGFFTAILCHRARGLMRRRQGSYLRKLDMQLRKRATEVTSVRSFQ